MHWLQKVIGILDKVGIFSRWTNVAGIAVLFLMVIVTFVDVIMRYIFNAPIDGVVEITEVMLIAAVFFAVAHTQNEKAHVSVDLITAKLTTKARIAIEFITTLLGLFIFIIIVWRTLAQVLLFVRENSVHSQHLLIPSAPFAAIIVLGCTALCLLLLRDLLANTVEALKLDLPRRHWLLMIGVPILVLALAILWMQPDLWQLNLPTVGLIGVVFSLLFFLSGMPIALVLILTSLVFIGHIRGPDTALHILGTEIYRTIGSYTWVVIASFVLMGYFCLFARFAEDLYLLAYRWLGHLRGGLAMATVGACTGFAAIVGETLSAVATMGAVALPEMKRYKYDNSLSAGSIAGGATIGPIIPPSIAFIIYGLLTQVSIGKLFIAGIIPGLLLGAAFVLVIYVWCWLRPNLGPPGERTAWRQRFVSLKAGGPIAVLFLLVIGGIYTGVFTPTEGGAIGAIGAVAIGLIMRRFTWKIFAQALLDAGKVISMVFLILVGGIMFCRFAAWCNLYGEVTEFFAVLGLSSAGIVLLILLIFFILGFVIDIVVLLLIGVPILHPVAAAYGVDPIWFAVLVVLVIGIGAISPPVGINLFALKGVARDIPIGIIYSGVMPFVLATIIVIGIVFAVPQLATWLPGLLE